MNHNFYTNMNFKTHLIWTQCVQVYMEIYATKTLKKKIIIRQFRWLCIISNNSNKVRVGFLNLLYTKFTGKKTDLK